MELTEMILKIRERMMDESLFESILKQYQEGSRAEGSGSSEEEYDAAKAGLPGLLSEEQLACLYEAEEICFEIAQWLAEFAFTRGVYAGFRQHFVHDAPANQFKALVFDSVLQMPGMQSYPEYCARRDKANDCFVRSRKRVTHAAADKVLEIELAWQNRFLGVCRHAFPLGYHFALSLIRDAASDGVFVWEIE